MGENERNFIVGILTSDEKVNKALIEKFEGQKNIAIIDLMNMDGESIKKVVNNASPDIVITAEDAFLTAGNRKKFDELIKADKNTSFLAIYNSKNAETMLEIFNILSKKGPIVLPCKIENYEDYRILTTNVQGVINEKTQLALRAKKQF